MNKKNIISNELTNIDLTDINANSEFAYLDGIFKDYKGDLLEFTQGKTMYQIEKFTALDEGNSPVHQYKFLLIQLRYALHEGRRMHLEVEKRKRRIRRYLKFQDIVESFKKDDINFETLKSSAEVSGVELKEVYDIDILIMELENQMYLDVLNYKGKMEEIRDFVKVLEHYREKYGKDVLNKKKLVEYDPAYWEQRLARQAYFDNLAQQLGISVGNLWAIERAIKPAILDDSNSQSMIDINNLEEIKQLARGSKIDKMVDDEMEFIEYAKKKLELINKEVIE